MIKYLADDNSRIPVSANIYIFYTANHLFSICYQKKIKTFFNKEMESYYVRFKSIFNYYIPFTEPMTVEQVKEEMSKQLNVSRFRMKIIFNGKILNDETRLDSIGVANESLLHLHIPNYENFLLKDSFTILSDAFSFFQNPYYIPHHIMQATLKELKHAITSRIIETMLMVFPDAQPIVDDVISAIRVIENSTDIEYGHNLSRIHDNSFLHFHIPSSDIKDLITSKCSTVSIYAIKDGDYKRQKDVSDVEDECDEPLVIDYERTLNTSALPFDENCF